MYTRGLVDKSKDNSSWKPAGSFLVLKEHWKQSLPTFVFGSGQAKKLENSEIGSEFTREKSRVHEEINSRSSHRIFPVARWRKAEAADFPNRKHESVTSRTHTYKSIIDGEETIRKKRFCENDAHMMPII